MLMRCMMKAIPYVIEQLYIKPPGEYIQTLIQAIPSIRGGHYNSATVSFSQEQPPVEVEEESLHLTTGATLPLEVQLAVVAMLAGIQISN